MEQLIYKQATIDLIMAHMHGVLDDAPLSDFTKEIYQMGHEHVVDVIRYIPEIEAIPVAWIQDQVDKGKWAELVQRWREAREREDTP